MTIHVDLAGRGYAVHVGRGLLAGLDRLVPWPDRARRAAVVTQAPVAAHHLSPVLQALERAGLTATVIEVPDGEGAKSAAVLASGWQQLASIPLSRQDVVVALGGGVVGDLGGFLAATWNRGVAVVQVPTTLLAQVDAAIGGKTGINLPHGKNLVGAFHQPLAVVADVDTLATLGERERIEGFGEVVKYGFIRDPEILDLLEADLAAARNGSPELLEQLVRRSAAVKAAVVGADELEAGERAHLNLGHTYGHAVEALAGYGTVLHGEAVSIGIAVALRIGAALQLHAPDLVDRFEALAVALGLPIRGPRLDRDAVWATLARDKKADDGVRFVLLEGLGRPVLRHVAPAVVDEAIEATREA